MTPGPRFSATTSACLIMRRAISFPSSVFRSMTVLRLLLLSSRKKKLSMSGLSMFQRRRARSPNGGRSILITSAPSHASICVQDGPAWSCVKSITRMPSSALVMGFSFRTSDRFGVPILGKDLVERIRAFRRQGLRRLVFVVFQQVERGLLAGEGVKSRQPFLGIAPQRRGKLVLDLGTGIDDRAHPIGPWIARRRVGQLEKMEQDATNLAAHGIALASPQAFDLLDQIVAVEAVVARAQGAQDLRLVLRPGVEIVLVTRSIRHRGIPIYAIGDDGPALSDRA